MALVEETFVADDADVQTFAVLSGDDNPIHVNSEAAAESMFGQQVVHGVCCLSWVSSMLAKYGDGTTILTGFDDVEFVKPVYLDEEITIQFTETISGDGKSGDTIRFVGRSESGETKFAGNATVIIR